jgi:hypothetical protein
VKRYENTQLQSDNVNGKPANSNNFCGTEQFRGNSDRKRSEWEHSRHVVPRPKGMVSAPELNISSH